MSKFYGEKQALNRVSFSFDDGLYGILGPNGAGKSTMMNLITDNLKPTEGRVLYNGKEIITLGKSYLTKLGYMPQQEGFYDAFSGRMFLSYMAEMKGVPRKQANVQIEDILMRVNLQSDAHRKISEYSGGMQKRLMLGQALLGNPEILLLDEPTAGLDPVERIRLRNYIHELSLDRIILFTTHIVSDIWEIADQVLMMKDGRIVKSGPIPGILRELQEETLEQAYLDVMGGGMEDG
ncbi:MAG: ATP-binding cassette domain-containing protein [Lachnospiraceae bacterium]|nr:ATP-binding cassette domain-containing protein [Lachnospiraceae bacterium]